MAEMTRTKLTAAARTTGRTEVQFGVLFQTAEGPYIVWQNSEADAHHKAAIQMPPAEVYRRTVTYGPAEPASKRTYSCECCGDLDTESYSVQGPGLAERWVCGPCDRSHGYAPNAHEETL